MGLRSDQHLVTFGATRGRAERSVPVRGFSDFKNTARQRAALAGMSRCERETGRTGEELRAGHQAQRAALLKRLGLTHDSESKGER